MVDWDIRRREPSLRAKVASLRNDALIALSARQIGASVVTGNVKDFELLHRFVPFDLEPFEQTSSDECRPRLWARNSAVDA